jgi:bacillithiol system protein YtxJ
LELLEMNWTQLNTPNQLEEIVAQSATAPVVIFKHSTSCSISKMALGRLERSWNDTEVTSNAYFLDLIAYRNISNSIAQKFDVVHESPQLIVIHKGKVIYEESHMGINYSDLKSLLGTVTA